MLKLASSLLTTKTNGLGGKKDRYKEPSEGLANRTNAKLGQLGYVPMKHYAKFYLVFSLSPKTRFSFSIFGGINARQYG